jgi:hypothetical protein
MIEVNLNADLQSVWLRLAKRFYASLVEREQRRIRIPQDAVRGCDEAPIPKGGIAFES